MIYLVRHGQTEWNREGRRQGRGDSPLTELGLMQSRKAGQAMLNILEGTAEADVTIVSSPAGRSLRTATIVAEELGMGSHKIQSTPMLAEMDFGEWQGLTDQEIAESRAEQWRERELNRWFFQYPGGESYPVLCSRVSQWMEAVQSQKGIIIAITHQWTSRVIRGQYLKMPREDMFELDHPHSQIVRLHLGEEQVFNIS